MSTKLICPSSTTCPGMLKVLKVILYQTAWKTSLNPPLMYTEMMKQMQMKDTKPIWIVVQTLQMWENAVLAKMGGLMSVLWMEEMEEKKHMVEIIKILLLNPT